MDIRGLLVRKSFHVAGAVLLAVPLFARIEPAVYYAALALAAGFLYSIQVKRPQILLDLRRDVFKSLEDVFASLDKLVPVGRADLKVQYDALLGSIERAIEAAERDYEKRGGYLGLLMGAVGVLISYNIFGPVGLLPAVVGLAVYDSFSALVGSVLGRHRLPAVDATVEGMLGGAVPTLAVFIAAGYGPLTSLVITAFVAVAEAYGVEDNLAIPLAAAAAAYMMLHVWRTPI
ncbi:MAG: phosphatidate cytidylyltransferase [Thermoproteus sp.]